jgi:hypothetical protein
MEVNDGSQLYAPAALPAGEAIEVPFGYGLGGPQSQSGRCEIEKDLLLLPRSEPWPSSRQLCRLNYPGFIYCISAGAETASLSDVIINHDCVPGIAGQPMGRKCTAWCSIRHHLCAGSHCGFDMWGSRIAESIISSWLQIDVSISLTTSTSLFIQPEALMFLYIFQRKYSIWLIHWRLD